MKQIINIKIKVLFQSLLLNLFILAPTLQATPLSIPGVPLYLGTAVNPNLLFTMDSSGSMAWEASPLDAEAAYSKLTRSPGFTHRDKKNLNFKGAGIWTHASALAYHIPKKIYYTKATDHLTGYDGRTGIPIFEGAKYVIYTKGAAYNRSAGDFGVDDINDDYDPDDNDSPNEITNGMVAGGNILSRRTRSSAVNTLYYNPELTYTPWVKFDGTLMKKADVECANHNPMRTGSTDFINTRGCINLTKKMLYNGAWRKYDFDWQHQLDYPADKFPMFREYYEFQFGYPDNKFPRRRYRNVQYSQNFYPSYTKYDIKFNKCVDDPQHFIDFPDSSKDPCKINSSGSKLELKPRGDNSPRNHHAWVAGQIRMEFYPAVYYEFDHTANPDDSVDIWDKTKFTQVEIRKSKTYGTTADTDRSNRIDCTAKPSCTYEEELQNFANWYQYYRSRFLLARAAIGQAFIEQSTSMRIGFHYIGLDLDNDPVSFPYPTPIIPVTPFVGVARAEFFNVLYDGHLSTDAKTLDGHFPELDSSGTPLREAASDIEQYFRRTDPAGPWGPEIGADQSSCRQNFHILMTDGFWNGKSHKVGDQDNVSGPILPNPNGADSGYKAEPPFIDNNLDTLADATMKAWKNDLRPDDTIMPNNVPISVGDPAYWQHLVTFTIGFGVNGQLDPDTDLLKIQSGKISWPKPVKDNATTVDDLWHAAINGHGDYFSASDPKSFADKLKATLSFIANLTSSSASVALNSGSTGNNAQVYQARFDSADWSGNILAFNLTLKGEIVTPPAWSAKKVIPAPSARKIYSINGTNTSTTNGIEFLWSELNATQKAQLNNDPKVLNYIRGDRTNEVSATPPGPFRNRPSTVLGDIIHAAPAFVSAPSFRYDDLWYDILTKKIGPEKPYSAFKTINQSRIELVYAGANDGMLHAFKKTDGKELFTYIPNVLFPKLPLLTDPVFNSTHQYFVDGSPVIIDGFIGNDWKTILAGNLRGGGQGIYAINITNPQSFSANVYSLWEFTDTDQDSANPSNVNFDADLGYTFSEANIVRMHNGKWVAIFGNGYNNVQDNAGDGTTAGDSVTGNAVVYIVDLRNGNIIKKFDTGVGTVNDPAGAIIGTSYPNGIGGVAPVDTDGDSIIDYLYAGDLFGNLWKFDVRSGDVLKWEIANGGTPLFVACTDETCTTSSSDTKHQPITSRPQIGTHITGSGQMIYFGTGRYFVDDDDTAIGQNTQTFYGIWDNNSVKPVTYTKDDFLQQTIDDEVTVSVDTDNDNIDDTSFELRETSNLKLGPTDWKGVSGSRADYLGWYMDLINMGSSPLTNKGERQVTSSVLRSGRIIFVTLLPADGPCSFGGESWLMELDAIDGSRLEFTPFDLNGDDKYNADDQIPDGTGKNFTIPGGKKAKIGITSTPGISTIADGTNSGEVKLNSGSDGNLETTKENSGGEAGRKSWLLLK